jgi:cyclohexa-1,5-dienecarbonyl-CoA hydratase
LRLPGWTYALDGRLLGAPGFEGVERWSREENCLPEFKVEEWGALVFVNLHAKAAPLAETLEDIPRTRGRARMAVDASRGAQGLESGARAQGRDTVRAAVNPISQDGVMISQDGLMEDVFQHIRFRIEDRVGRVTFARPPLNIFTIAMMREVEQALTECMGRRDVVAVVFDAVAGSRAFSAGVSVEEHQPETVYQMLESFHNVFRTLEQMAKPALAVVDGAALGGGCELVAGCDIVISASGARYGQPEIKLGVFPPVAAVLLPRVIGERRARELLLTGELFDAREALRLGLVSHVVESDRLEAKLQEILSRLRELSAPALEMTRRALDAGRGRPFLEALARVEDLYLNELMKTEDAHEGVKAFMEKRKPDWRNR